MAPIAISPEPKPAAGALTTTFDDTLRFYLNGTKVVLDDIDPEVTLLEYLRGIGLTGTKLYVRRSLSLSHTRVIRFRTIFVSGRSD